MSLTVSNLAKEYYNIYSLTNSDTYSQNQVDASEVSKEAYNVSDMDSAFETLATASDADFASMSSVSSYVKNAFALSQSSAFSELEDSGSIVEDLLSGSSASSAMYDVLEEETESVAASVSNVISLYSSNVSSYQTYLEENSLDASV